MEAKGDDILNGLPTLEPAGILQAVLRYRGDPTPEDQKVFMGVGMYRDEEGKPYTFDCVKRTMKEIGTDPAMHFEYLPPEGPPAFGKIVEELVYGADHPVLKTGNVLTFQTVAGSGAMRIGLELISKYLPGEVLFSNPPYLEYPNICKQVGLNWRYHPYYNPKTKAIDFEAFIECISKAIAGSIIILQACGHNPSGIDLTQDEWKKVAAICKERRIIPFFDMAYQGLVSGDLDTDAWAIRHFANEGMQIFVAYSCSKTFGIYNLRAGALSIICKSKETREKLLMNMRFAMRMMCISSPAIGPAIIMKIMANSEDVKEWKSDLKRISEHIKRGRQLLFDALAALKVQGNWDHVLNQKGMFCYIGLTPEQIDHMAEKSHVYVLRDGRMTVSVINTKNVKQVAQAIHDAILNRPAAVQ